MNYHIRKIIAIVLIGISAIFAIACLVQMIVYRCADYNLWGRFVGDVVIVAAIAVLTFKPSWNGQYSYNFKQRTWGWIRKSPNDPNGLLLIPKAMLGLWFSSFLYWSIIDDLRTLSTVEIIIAIPFFALIIVALVLYGRAAYLLHTNKEQ